MSEKKVSMQNIADAMGISKFSVSVAISDGYGVSEELRFKIILKAIEMGYDFGKNYRHKRRKNKTVSLVVGYDEKAQNFFWGEIIRAIEKRLLMENYDFKIIIISSCKDNTELVARIHENHSVGVVFISDCDEGILSALNTLKIPAVIVDAIGYASLYHSFIGADNYTAGIVACNKLVEKGHKKIAFVGQKSYSYSFKQRCNGFMDGAAEHPGVEARIIAGKDADDAFDSGALAEALREKDGATGYFCGNDSVALVLCRDARELGYSIPGDISVIGFDNLKTDALAYLDLTTFEADKTQIGVETVNLLIENLRNPEFSNKVVSVKTRFIEGSTL